MTSLAINNKVLHTPVHAHNNFTAIF